MQNAKGKMQNESRLSWLFAFLLLHFAFICGCGGCGSNPEAYPGNFTYPERQEWIVVELPKEPPTKPEPPGELDEAIRRINERGGKVLDPMTIPSSLRNELNEFLKQSFGSPAKPTILGDDETRSLATGLGLTDENLATG